MKVNLGCCSIQPDGWTNVDREDHGQEVVADVVTGLPFEDGTVEAVVAHHSLQQIPIEQLPKALAEVRRVLVPGGVLRLSVPDILGGFEALQAGDLDWFPNGEPSVTARFCAWLTWYGTNITPLTRLLLRQLLLDAGFSEVMAASSGVTSGGSSLWICELDGRAGESIFMEAKC